MEVGSSSINTIRVILKEEKMGVAYRAHKGDYKWKYRVWVEHQEERDHLEDLGVDGRTISNRV
jgi:hypothetical protein